MLALYKVSSGAELPVSITNANRSTLALPATTIPYIDGTSYYKANLTVSFTNGQGSSSASINLTPVLPDLIVDILGGNGKVGPTVNFTLDGSKSRDPGIPGATLTYAWTCGANNGSFAVPCPTIATPTASIITVSGADLTLGATYNYTLTVTNPATGKTAFKTVSVYDDPNVTFTCFVQLATTSPDGVHVPLTRNTGFNVTCAGSTTYTYSWFTVPSVPLTSDTLAAGSQTGPSFAFRPNVLVNGTSYIVAVNVTSGLSSNTASFAFATMSPPYGGSITVASNGTDTSRGRAYADPWTLSADSWTSSYSNALTYQFTANFSNVLSIVGPQSSASTRNNINIPTVGTGFIRLTVWDEYGHYTTKDSQTITTDSPLTGLDGAAVAAFAQNLAATSLASAVNSGDTGALLAASLNVASLLSVASNTAGADSGAINTVKTQLLSTLNNVDLTTANSGQCNAVVGTVFSVGLGTLDNAGKTQGMLLVQNALGQISTSSSDGAGLNADIRTAAVGALDSFWGTTSPARRLSRRQSGNSFYQTIIDTYHSVGQATNVALVCGAGAVLDSTANARLASASIQANGVPSVNLGTSNAAVGAPLNNAIDWTTAPLGTGCVRISALMSSVGIYNANPANQFYTSVLSVNIDPTDSSALRGQPFNFQLKESQAPAANTKPVVQRWDGTSWVSSDCGLTKAELQNDNTYLISGWCNWSPARTSTSSRRLQKRQSTSSFPDSQQVAVSRAQDTTSPSPSPTENGLTSSGLSGGGIAGIVVGSVAGACLIGAGVFYFVKKR
ncbi:hypothetical protein HDV00_008650 [Rhizophlyctis rosea]|nr:hypothetical protein HDV00_008650 [Rhizophlyctis rosea]